MVETEVASLWKEILRSELEIYPDHDFLEVGGNSILLLQLQLKLQARFAIKVPMATLALNSSFDHMCRCVREALDRKSSHSTIIPDPSKGELDCSLRAD